MYKKMFIFHVSVLEKKLHDRYSLKLTSTTRIQKAPIDQFQLTIIYMCHSVFFRFILLLMRGTLNKCTTHTDDSLGKRIWDSLAFSLAQMLILNSIWAAWTILLPFILGVVKRNPLFFHSISCKNNGFRFTTPNICSRISHAFYDYFPSEGERIV